MSLNNILYTVQYLHVLQNQSLLWEWIRAGLSFPEALGNLSIGGPSQLKLKTKKKVITTLNS